MALASLTGLYQALYAYDAQDAADPWKKYVAGAPAFLNDLAELSAGRGYWLSVSQAAGLMVANELVAPQASITAPETGQVTGAPTIQVTGIVTAQFALESVTVNGILATLSANVAGKRPSLTDLQSPPTTGHPFSAQVPLAAGSQVLNVVATDAAGQQGTASRTVAVDRAGPQITDPSRQPVGSLSTRQGRMSHSPMPMRSPP